MELSSRREARLADWLSGLGWEAGVGGRLGINLRGHGDLPRPAGELPSRGASHGLTSAGDSATATSHASVGKAAGPRSRQNELQSGQRRTSK